MYRIFLVFLMLCSCSEKTPSIDPVQAILLSEEGGVFRGNDIGDSQPLVLQREEENIVYNMPDELTCRIPSSMKDSTFYDITYNFSEKGLYVIELDVFPQTNEQAQTLFSKFRAYYNTKFGESSEDEGFTMWKIKSARYKDVEVSMVDESIEAERPYISIVFHEYGN
jgi:hypothetical protein